MIAHAIRFLLSNFTLTFLVVGLIASAIAMARSPRRDAAMIAEKLLAWFVFFSIGLANLYNFVMHCFFGETAAAFIGWADSPFQFEVGAASLGFAAVGLLAAFRIFDFRIAAILGSSLFTLGAAFIHVREMVDAENFAPGNAGVIFYTDIAVPLVGFLLLWFKWLNPLPGEGRNAAQASFVH